MAKQEPNKSLGELLNDPSITTKPAIDKSNLAPEKMNFKNVLMSQAFQVFITHILDRHGNVSIMARKMELSRSEIENALTLVTLVGESYDNLTSRVD